jgi:hypothetical protein
VKEPNQPANDPELSALLRQARVAPGLPPRFQSNVWRRIRDNELTVPRESWFESLANLVLRPRFAVVAASALLLAGIMAGTWEGRQLAKHEAQINYLTAVAPQFSN